MREAISEIRAAMDHLNVRTEDRPAMTQLLVGEIVGNGLTVPSSPVENPITFFRLNHREQALKFLSEINEQLVIDIDATLEVAYKLWVTRYRLIHEPGSAVTKRLLSLMIRDGGYQIPPHLVELSNRYPTAYANEYMVNSFKGDDDDHIE